jgi:hypothetical protein
MEWFSVETVAGDEMACMFSKAVIYYLIMEGYFVNTVAGDGNCISKTWYAAVGCRSVMCVQK